MSLIQFHICLCVISCTWNTRWMQKTVSRCPEPQRSTQNSHMYVPLKWPVTSVYCLWPQPHLLTAGSVPSHLISNLSSAITSLISYDPMTSFLNFNFLILFLNLQFFFKIKFYIYCNIYIFLNHLSYVKLYYKFLFVCFYLLFMSHWQSFWVLYVSNPIFPINPVVLVVCSP